MGVVYKLSKVLTCQWLAGPMADKELRVASRKKRFYLMRCLYVIVLGVMVCIGWLDRSWSYSGLNMSQYLSELAMAICRNVAMMQFFLMQAMAVLLLSNAISEEANKRSLGVLLTTPITSLQIAGGKVFSKLIFMIQLLCLSLPVLAIIRVFGGVPWESIVKMSIVTVMAVFFVSSITLFIATFFRKAYVVLIVSCVVIVLYYLAYRIPILEDLLDVVFSVVPFSEWLILSLNPLLIFEMVLDDMSNQSFYGSGGLFYFPGGGYHQVTAISSFVQTGYFFAIQCGVIFGLSWLFLLAAARRMRGVAIKQLAGGIRKKRWWGLRVIEACINKLPRISRQKPIRTVGGQAIVWKEMHNSLLRGDLLRGRLIYLLLIGLNGTVLLLFFLFTIGDPSDAMEIYTFCMAILACLVTAVTAASAISKEREVGSWAILLCTPMSDWAILWGKVVGVLRRSVILWVGLLMLAMVLCYVEIFEYAVLPASCIVVVEVTLFLTGVGVYFSTLFRKTSGSVMATLAVGVGLWAVPPLLVEMFGLYSWNMDEILSGINPAMHFLIGLERDYFSDHYLTCPNCTFWDSNGGIIIAIASIPAYFCVGLFLLWRAKLRLRKNYF